jgi:hypothetical protein
MEPEAHRACDGSSFSQHFAYFTPIFFTVNYIVILYSISFNNESLSLQILRKFFFDPQAPAASPAPPTPVRYCTACGKNSAIETQLKTEIHVCELCLVRLFSTLTDLNDRWPTTPFRYEDELPPKRGEKCGGIDVILGRKFGGSDVTMGRKCGGSDVIAGGNNGPTPAGTCPRKSEVYAGNIRKTGGEGKTDIDVLGFMEAHGGGGTWPNADRQARSATLLRRIFEQLTFMHHQRFKQK